MNFPAFTNTSKVNANEIEAVDLREQFMVSSHKWVVGVLEDLIVVLSRFGAAPLIA